MTHGSRRTSPRGASTCSISDACGDIFTVCLPWICGAYAPAARHARPPASSPEAKAHNIARRAPSGVGWVGGWVGGWVRSIVGFTPFSFVMTSFTKCLLFRGRVPCRFGGRVRRCLASRNGGPASDRRSRVCCAGAAPDSARIAQPG